jgi:hypothetical protein
LAILYEDGFELARLATRKGLWVHVRHHGITRATIDVGDPARVMEGLRWAHIHRKFHQPAVHRDGDAAYILTQDVDRWIAWIRIAGAHVARVDAEYVTLAASIINRDPLQEYSPVRRVPVRVGSIAIRRHRAEAMALAVPRDAAFSRIRRLAGDSYIVNLLLGSIDTKENQ